MPNKFNIGQRIKYWRQIRKLSQIELATKVGMNQSQISKIEKGERGVLAHELPAIAKTLEVPITDILEDGLEDKNTA